MSSPFDDPDGAFLVLANQEDQYCIWPMSLRVPDGWLIRHGPTDRHAALEYIDQHWTDMRPLGLRRKMNSKPTVTQEKL